MEWFRVFMPHNWRAVDVIMLILNRSILDKFQSTHNKLLFQLVRQILSLCVLKTLKLFPLR